MDSQTFCLANPLTIAHALAAKEQKNLSLEIIAKAVGREEVAIAVLIYGQAKASEEDLENLTKRQPDGDAAEEAARYRLFEIVQNYEYAYKAMINEKFGNGIMSAITFSTKMEREDDYKETWCKITLQVKWHAESTQLDTAIGTYWHYTRAAVLALLVCLYVNNAQTSFPCCGPCAVLYALGTEGTLSSASLHTEGSSYTANDTESLPIIIFELDTHSNVSRSPRPPRLRHLSELIDPAELRTDVHIRSPSGHLHAPEEYPNTLKDL
ncbi:Cyanate hydratase [Elasticomyces elasticus]|nr:Cyanate hydratase [Elasticomyces elasticus]KAK3631711.1 Cyanate hydratase [Elasticomyces elasticus]KAK4908397.1 Cyanate hydratase [Elasticomyces elasticus]KAK5751725.1 Cyanate hydratase [Elasticomyces elasticus]